MTNLASLVLPRLALMALGLLTGATAASADCRLGYFRWGPSYPELRTTMNVARDTACRKELPPLDFVALKQITVTRPPQHGAAGKASKYDFAYKPRDGYIGPDFFEIEVSFDYNGQPRASRLSFDVTVE